MIKTSWKTYFCSDLKHCTNNCTHLIKIYINMKCFWAVQTNKQYSFIYFDFSFRDLCLYMSLVEL